MFLGQAFSLPLPPAHACCHAANTHAALVHVRCFGGQVSVPALCLPLPCSQTAAELQLPRGGTRQLLALPSTAEVTVSNRKMRVFWGKGLLGRRVPAFVKGIRKE